MLAGPIADPLPNWVTDLSNVSAEQRWVLLTSLKASASYQFRVSAVNSVGEGSPSESSNVVSLPQEGMTKNITWFVFQFKNVCVMFWDSVVCFSPLWPSSRVCWVSKVILRDHHSVAAPTGRAQEWADLGLCYTLPSVWIHRESLDKQKYYKRGAVVLSCRFSNWSCLEVFCSLVYIFY